MKYIMIIRELGQGTKCLYPIIFPDTLVHADVADRMLRGELRGARIDSAGFLSPLNMECHGRSESLGISSKPERDTQTIRMIDYGGQFMVD